MSMLRDRILNARDRRSEIVHIAEWDVDVEVVSLSGADRADLMEKGFDPNGNMKIRTFYPEVLVACMRDPETHEPIFTRADRDAILSRDGNALDEVMKVAVRISGLANDSKEAVKSPVEAES